LTAEEVKTALHGVEFPPSKAKNGESEQAGTLDLESFILLYAKAHEAEAEGTPIDQLIAELDDMPVR
jgi:hypothetical protein